MYLDLHTSFSLDCYSNFHLNKRRYFIWFNASMFQYWKLLKNSHEAKTMTTNCLCFYQIGTTSIFHEVKEIDQVGKVAWKKPVEWFRPILPNKQWFVSNGTCESFDTSNLKRDIAKLFPPEEKTPSSQGVFLWVIKIRSTNFT